MQIIFNSSLGTHTVDVDIHDTIDNVKNKLKEKTGHDVSLISKPLEGTQTLESYGLKHKDKLSAVFDGNERQLKIQVKLRGNIIPVEVHIHADVKDVNCKIKTLYNLDMSIHELLYKGKVLIETAKLNALGISTGAELTLRVRKIDLTVLLPDTTSIKVKVPVNDKVENVIKKIQKKRRSLQGCTIQLTYNSCTLDKNKELHHCGVIHGAVLRVAAHDVKLTVTKEYKPLFDIKMPVSDTVKVLKQKIQDRMGHRVEDQRLSLFLHDNDTLLQSNIYHNIDVHLDTYGRDKLVSYKSDGWYKGYNKDTGRWEELIQYPEWRDGGTSGCAHPDGVILAGAADHKTCNHVVLLNVRTKQPVPFPDLPHAVRSVGIVYNAGVLTIAGGGQSVDGQWNYSNQVYQLNVGMSGRWVELPSLPHAVAWPLLACDDSFLYVVGGFKCKSCVKLDNKNQQKWTTFTDLPVECDNVISGELVINNTVCVMSPSRHMTLNTTNNAWTTQEYSDTNITRCTPVWYRGIVIASVLRGDSDSGSVECYSSTINKWRVLKGISASAGAGLFLTVKY